MQNKTYEIRKAKKGYSINPIGYHEIARFAWFESKKYAEEYMEMLSKKDNKIVLNEGIKEQIIDFLQSDRFFLYKDEEINPFIDEIIKL